MVFIEFDQKFSMKILHVRVVHKLRHALGGRGLKNVSHFKQNKYFFYGSFVTRGGGGIEKVIILRDVINERPHRISIEKYIST